MGVKMKPALEAEVKKVLDSKNEELKRVLDNAQVLMTSAAQLAVTAAELIQSLKEIKDAN
jgi:hypothetical protein